jgi:hypothetical protein
LGTPALRTPPASDRFLDWSRGTLALGLPTEDEPLRLLWAMTLGWRTAFIIGEISRSYGESKEKSRKILAAQQSKKLRMQSGEVLKHHCAPRYYSYNKDKNVYQQNELTFIVKRIINEFLQGSSLYQISKGLNDDKIRSLRYANKQPNWSRAAIKSLLESKCLYGEFLGIPDYFGEPVIDKQTSDIYTEL